MGASNTLPSYDPDTRPDLTTVAVQRGPAEWFAELNPEFGVLPDDRDPHQQQFATRREQALALGTRTIEALAAHNHDDPDRRERAITGTAAVIERDRSGPER
jgi:hypothetical protein